MRLKKFTLSSQSLLILPVSRTSQDRPSQRTAFYVQTEEAPAAKAPEAQKEKYVRKYDVTGYGTVIKVASRNPLLWIQESVIPILLSTIRRTDSGDKIKLLSIKRTQRISLNQTWMRKFTVLPATPVSLMFSQQSNLKLNGRKNPNNSSSSIMRSHTTMVMRVPSHLCPTQVHHAMD